MSPRFLPAVLSLLFVPLVAQAETTTRPDRWPISLDEAKGSGFPEVGLQPVGSPALQDGVITLAKSGDGFSAPTGDLERFVVEMDLAKPSTTQAFDLRFLGADGKELFKIQVLPDGKLNINGTSWTPKDFSTNGRARYLFAVNQQAKRMAVLLQYATASKGEKAADESGFVAYQSDARIAKVEAVATGEGEIVIRELNVFRPDIAALGDSTCQGGNQYSPIPTLTKEARPWSFQYQLEKLIDPTLRVTNLGYSGHKISAMKHHVERAEMLGARYAIAIIGVNSITAKSLTDEQVQAQYREWVELAAAKGIKVYSCTMYPKSYGKNADAQRQYDMLNDWIRKTVPTLGGNVIELHNGMVGPDGITTPQKLTSDGHHPNGAGYKKGAGIIRPAIEPIIQEINASDAK